MVSVIVFARWCAFCSKVASLVASLPLRPLLNFCIISFIEVTIDTTNHNCSSHKSEADQQSMSVLFSTIGVEPVVLI